MKRDSIFRGDGGRALKGRTGSRRCSLGRCSLFVLSSLLASLAFSPAALAGVMVSGTVTDMNGLSMGETVEVRAWSWLEDELLPSGERYTGYAVREGDSVFVDPHGAYEFDLAPGTYKLDARVGVTTGVAPCMTDPDDDTRLPCRYPPYSQANARYWLEERWHEAGAGFEDFYVQEDAVLVSVQDGLPIMELNFRLRLAGGVEGRVLGLAADSMSEPRWLAGADIRMEQVSDSRRHHNSVTIDDPVGKRHDRVGEFVSRGLRATLLHRLLVHDREGYNKTHVHPTMHTPSAGELFDFGTITLAPMEVDPYPTNRSLESALDIGRWHFDQDPPPIWSTGTTSFARIAPRNTGVVNWFCWQVGPEDRFIVTVTTLDTIPALPGRYHPWTDPILKVVNVAAPDEPIPGTAVDRYSGPGPLDAMVDTLLIDENATLCAVVSVAGDDDFVGMGQGSAGPYVLTIERSPNPHAAPPGLGGSFAVTCSGGVVTSSPLVFPVLHERSQGGDPFDLQVQIYKHGTDPDASVDIDRTFAADVGAPHTQISLDISLLTDNTRYSIRVRSDDGVHYSAWTMCDFWTNLRNNVPSAIEILTPTPGTVLPLNTTEVMVEVTNATDSDSVVPGTTLELAWCSSVDPDFGDCPASESQWNLVTQSSLDPADTTSFFVAGLTNREAWHIKVCAIDETGICGPSDQTWVLVGDEDDDRTTVDDGCCATARRGHPGSALLALLALALLLPRKRRRVGAD